MNKLNQEQKRRLVSVLNECLDNNSVRSMAKRLNLSVGYISQISNNKIEIIEREALVICQGLGINPYYILEESMPKYQNWEEAFM